MKPFLIKIIKKSKLKIAAIHAARVKVKIRTNESKIKIITQGRGFLLFKLWNKQAIIDTILMVAGYTYGPLLGLFAFGFFTKWKLHDFLVPVVCIAAPSLTFLLNWIWIKNNFAFQIGPELILYNGIITFLMLMLIRKKDMNVLTN